MNKGYILDPYGKKQRIADLDTLKELAISGVIHAGTVIHDEAANKVFVAGSHPFLKGKCKPAPTAPPGAQSPPVPPPPSSASQVINDIGGMLNRATAPPPRSATAAPSPTAPPMGSGTVTAGNTFVSEEITTQYTTCNWWILWGFLPLLGCYTSPLSLVFWIYAIFRKQSLRQRAAELGFNPNDIARVAQARFWGTAKIFVVVGGLLFAVVIAGGLLTMAGSTVVTGCSPARNAYIGEWRYGPDVMVRLNRFGDGKMLHNGSNISFNWNIEGENIRLSSVQEIYPNGRTESHKDTVFLAKIIGGGREMMWGNNGLILARQ